MMTPSLRRDVLDGSYTPDSATRPSRHDALVHKLLEARLSRRALFGSVAATSATLPILGSVARAAAGFDLTFRDGVAVFAVDEIPLWTLDPSRFDGTPAVRVRRSTR